MISTTKDWRSQRRMRVEVIAAAQADLKVQHEPRLLMTAGLLLPAAFALAASSLLLRAGIDSMVIRYPLATLAGYCALTGLVYAWLRHVRRSPKRKHITDSGTDAYALAGANFAISSSSPETTHRNIPANVSNDLGQAAGSTAHIDGDAIFVIVLSALAMAILGVSFIWPIYKAPSLLAEVLVDGVPSTTEQTLFFVCMAGAMLTSVSPDVHTLPEAMHVLTASGG